VVDDELSIGDYVLTNGTLAAMVVIDAVTRLLARRPGDDRARWTNPSAAGCWNIRTIRGQRIFAGRKCRRCCLSGNHAAIAKCAGNRRRPGRRNGGPIWRRKNRIYEPDIIRQD